MTLVTALLILLRSASKITHKAQAVTCLAAKWHVCATIESFETVDGETPRLVDRASGHGYYPTDGDTGGSDSEDYGDEEDDFDNNNLIPAYAYSTISFQKRQALGTYIYAFASTPKSHIFTLHIYSYIYSSHEFLLDIVVNYFENNKAGITVFGFTLDRGTLHTIFGIEMSLVLWLLGKTIGIS